MDCTRSERVAPDSLTAPAHDAGHGLQVLARLIARHLSENGNRDAAPPYLAMSDSADDHHPELGGKD